MIKRLKMTDISATEVRRVLDYVRSSALICPEILETDRETILTCEVGDGERVIFGNVLRELSDFVYTDDENETPFCRLSSLVTIRKLRLGIIEQGFRGKLTETLVKHDACVTSAIYFNDKSDALEHFDCNKETEVAAAFARAFGLDVVISGFAEFDGDGLISSAAKICVFYAGKTYEQSYFLLGTDDEIAEKLSFLAAALTDRKIY